MAKVKISLPTVYDPREWPQPYSAASMFLGAAAEARPHLRDRLEFHFQSFGSESDPLVFAEAMVAAKPDILGLGIYTWNETVIEAAIPIIHERSPQTRIFLGGLSVLYSDANYVHKFPEVDLFFRGDGEKAFPEVLEHYLDGTYEEIVKGNILIAGVSSKANFMSRVQNRSALVMSEVVSYYLRDETGTCFFERHADEYWDCVWWELSRGCVYTCAFCGFDAQELGFRHHTIQRVLDEFDVFLEKKVKRLFITDAILGGKRANAKEILRGLSEPHRRNHGMYIYGFIRPELVDEEFARLLHTSNFGFVNVGLQTVNPAVPKEMRTNNLPEIRKNLPWLSHYGVRYQTDLIAGFPGDTYDGFLESVRFIIEEARPTRFRVYQLSVLPGTPLYRMAQEKGPEWVTYDPKDGAVTGSYSWDLPELHRMLSFANFGVALYNYFTQHNWLGDESRFRSLDLFHHLYLRTQQDAEEFGRWDQKAASLNQDEVSDQWIDAFLRREAINDLSVPQPQRRSKEPPADSDGDADRRSGGVSAQRVGVRRSGTTMRRYDLSSPEAMDLAPQAIPVGHVIVVDEQERVLVGKRHLEVLYEPGKWNLPGGCCEDGESYEATAVRELHEEFGLKLDAESLQYLRGYCCVYDDRVINAVYFLAYVGSDARIRVAKDEFSTGGFYPLADVAQWDLAFQQDGVIQDYLQEPDESLARARWVRAAGDRSRQTHYE